MAATPFPHGDAARLVRAKVKKMCRPPLFRTTDHEDVAQRALTLALERWTKYDPARGTPTALLATMIDHAIVSIIRSESAAKRGRLRTSNADVGVRPAPPPSMAPEDRDELRAVMRSLPPRLALLAKALASEGTVQGAASRAGIPRSTARDLMRQLRRRLTDAGFGPSATS
jgi:DNA-directed RNA polymerase specialized sigma24 family protein